MKRVILNISAILLLLPSTLVSQECPKGTSQEFLHGNTVKTLMSNGEDF
jgi:hypothetical protein